MENKTFVRHDPLPAKCGSQCPLYDLSTHTCIISKLGKKANSTCEFKYTVDDVVVIANTDVRELLQATTRSV